MNRTFSPLILAALLIFLIGPFLIIVAASLSAGDTLTFPPQGLSLRWIAKVFTVESFRDSFIMSVPSKDATRLFAMNAPPAP